MTRLSLTKKSTLGSHPATPLAANSADFSFTAAGVNFADGASFEMSGDDLLLVYNGDGAAQTITISSVVDGMNRKGDITAYSIGAGEYAVFDFSEVAGWRQTNGKLYFCSSDADVKFAVIHISR